jgi:uncharacterized caspase-like protein
VVVQKLEIPANERRIEFRFPVNLEPGLNRIEVLASNAYAEGRGAVEVTYTRGGGQNQDILPNLWILSVGVNRYDASELNKLGFAVNDAREIVNTFKAQEGKLYRKVNSLLIADGEALAPTRENSLDNLGYIRQAGQRDVIVLFIAGHGMNDDGGNFYFLPSDAGFNADGSIRPSRAISGRDINAALDLPGKKIVLIDACHSEGASGRRTRGVDNNRLVRDLQDDSTVIFSSSRGSELSQEDPKLGHGLFTYAIIQGMKGKADLIKNGLITMKELDAYVSETVPLLGQGLQHPTTSVPDGYFDFTIADTKQEQP